MKGNNKISLQQFRPLSEAEVKDIFLRGFSLCSCPQHTLKVLLLVNRTCVHVLDCERNFSYFSPDEL